MFGSADNAPAIKGVSSHDDGVQGFASAEGKSGVAGIHSGAGHGLFGASGSGAGVLGKSDTGIGVFGQSNGHTADDHHSGVAGLNDGAGTGVFGRSLRGAGVLGRGSPAGHFDADVEVTGDIRLINQDCAEEFDIVSVSLKDAEPGTVMVLDDCGALQPSSQAYDKRVAGVVSGAGDFKPGIILGKQASEAPRMPIALLGKVYCKVDARYAPVEVGDLLTTSDTLGHAMKVQDTRKAFGAVIGKALRPLSEGRDLIPILIALQ